MYKVFFITMIALTTAISTHQTASATLTDGQLAVSALDINPTGSQNNDTRRISSSETPILLPAAIQSDISRLDVEPNLPWPKLRMANFTFESVGELPAHPAAIGAGYRLAKSPKGDFTDELFGAAANLADIASVRSDPTILGVHAGMGAMIANEKANLNQDNRPRSEAPFSPTSEVDLWAILLVGLGLIYYQASRGTRAISNLGGNSSFKQS